MSETKKQSYVIDLDLFKEAYKEKHNKEITVYDLAEILGVSYQTINSLSIKPVKGIGYLKTMAKLCGLPINKLVKKKQ